ncbi:MAG: alkaline shock response membrane anchor protein AmaP [Candidatus Abyssobacteria bacterium SURF_17]|jgi:uncharacterized alkaline shock family protein YloU|uniref:Alkaline shock response membrane anchor protein AmaP n=1 Tax=Candidatus Abyssobacteria bacterium SURF_17 TaxID=2093361 RepID=A0A419F2V7_9BACT|nr:MAG: alkaline shock response membrane anchor protein AmaP [Candidatus Abyssubacteria bacterium SURF_17]
MRFIKTTLLVILSGLLFLAAFCLVLIGLMGLDQEFTAVMIHAITKAKPPMAYVVGGLFVFLLSLIVYNLAGRDADSSATFSFAGVQGPIRISLRAVEDYIEKHFSERPVVHSVRSRVVTTRDRKRLRVRALVSVSSEQNLKDAGETVQREIVRCLKEGLGLENVETVVVSVNKIITRKSSRFPSSKAPADELP